MIATPRFSLKINLLKHQSEKQAASCCFAHSARTLFLKTIIRRIHVCGIQVNFDQTEISHQCYQEVAHTFLGVSLMDDAAEVWESMDLYDEWHSPDNEEGREEWPEGFKWTCCDKTHDAPGCFRSKHDATYDAKRARNSSDSRAKAIVVLVSDDEE